RMKRLAERIEDFLVTGNDRLEFSVREDALAPLHNAAAELENRVLLAGESLSEECRRTSRLTADISHQLKTPLASLRLFCEMDGGAHMAEELDQLERMETLIHSLLRLERLCADGYDFTWTLRSVPDVVRAAWENLAAVYPDRRLEIIGEAHMRCDEKWLGEAFLNLLKNACEHTRPGGLIRVTFEETRASIFCSVEDDGGGVSRDDLPHLFRRFYRAQGQETKGAGIGLPIVREIIRRHHGAVRAENGPMGLRVIIDLPRLENMA
ncbi:MAG: HAMP domain-containing histidine kinase, partial [Clostridia bacterium]|nr:HAMP domain-containing histidine kinase [Clostridia bacterium]